MAEIVASDWRDIINTLIAEANGEGPEGMRRVGETILNRAAIRGLSPGEVVRQPSQYTGYFAPGAAAVEAQRDPRARSAAEAAWELARQPGDPTDGADHYKANYVNPGWADQMPSTGSFGQHDFYRSAPVPAEALAQLLTRAAPTPAAMPPSVQDSRARADALGALRGAPMAAPSVADMYSGIFRQPDLTQRGAIDQSVNGLSQSPALADALQRMLGAAEGPAVATIPTTAVGGPPTTRTVQSVPAPSPSDAVGAMPAFSAVADMFGRATPAAKSLTASARPSSFAGQDTAPSRAASAADAIAEVFGPSGTTNPNKSQDRLPPTVAANAFAPEGLPAFGGLDPLLARAAPTPAIRQPAAQPAAKPATRTITEQIENPEWAAAQAQAKLPAGMKLNFGSRDTVKQKQAGIATAAALPQFITRTRQVPVAAAPMAARSPLQIAVSGANVIRGSSPSERIAESFRGVSSGRIYEPGKLYQNGSGTFKANADGSFTNTESGSSTRGSSSGGRSLVETSDGMQWR